MRRETKRDRMEKEEEARKVEEDYGSAWPGHHTPLLMDRWVGREHYQVSPSLTFSSPDTSPASPPSSPPVSRISQMGNSNKVPSQPFSLPLPSTSTSTSSSSGRLRPPCLAVAKLGKSPCGRSESQPKQSQVFFFILSLQILDIFCK